MINIMGCTRLRSYRGGDEDMRGVDKPASDATKKDTGKKGRKKPVLTPPSNQMQTIESLMNEMAKVFEKYGLPRKEEKPVLDRQIVAAVRR